LFGALGLLSLFGFAACADDEASQGARLGAAGESCTARRDCAGGLACIEQVCVDPSADAGVPGRRGGVGESCRATNDCESGLACLGNVCAPAEVGLSVTGMGCYRVECETKDECCADFRPSPSCPLYEMDCDADPIYCPTYRSLCLCNRDCQDSLCVDLPPPCESHAECVSFIAPFCVAGVCSECAEHGDCAGESDRCVGGVCQAPCSRDEQCPLLHACQDGECVEVGCGSDRECAFLRRDERAVCRDGGCSVPCARDADCATSPGSDSFQVCEAGECVFVGCESDAECRALLGLSETFDRARAVCR
jgi:hypothetical protein